MPYILLSLWADDDEATCVSNAFALKVHERRGAAHLIQGETPAHDDLKGAAEASPDAAIVIFAHGGPSLSARRESEAWITPRGLATILTGRRVYAFACSTFKPQTGLALSTFASLAVDECIRVFVGHDAPIMTPFAGQKGATKNMDDVIFSLLESFIDGEDEAATLKDIGRRQVVWDQPLEIDLPSEDPQREGAFGWSSAAFLLAFFNSLQVWTKTRAALLDRDSERAHVDERGATST